MGEEKEAAVPRPSAQEAVPLPASRLEAQSCRGGVGVGVVEGLGEGVQEGVALPLLP